MKKVLYSVIFAGIFFIIFLPGCKHVKENRAAYQIVPVEFNNSMEIKLSDFVNSIDIIPLETTGNNLLGTVGNIFYHGDRLYITSAHRGRNRKLYIFDSKGKFQLVIDKQGQGPGEYREMADYVLSESSDVLIFSNLEKIVRYDSLGNFMQEQKNNFLLKDFSNEIDNSVFLFKQLNLKEKDRSLLVKYNLTSNKEEPFFTITNHELRKMSGVTNFNTFSICDNDIYFNYPFCDTIFNVTSKERVAAFYVDFGKKKLPQNLFGDEVEIIPKMRMVKKNGGVDAITGFNVSNNYLYICFTDFEHTDYFSLFNLKTKQILTACKIVDDMFFKGEVYSFIECGIPREYDGEDLLWTLDAGTLIRAYDNYKKRADKEEWDNFASANVKLVSVCNALKEEDNPVILRLKLKN